ncbi:hypothetical protein [Actinokineospora sp. NBRC 105648]|uniref:hypothetical protein n=1 Tax=Actinokineospora sp. NBRC 105648 TaxID=3032206 RepID=UPI0025538EA4|nr:hypothetical protein [Actinokineospora sp. NBRC 105648]
MIDPNEPRPRAVYLRRRLLAVGGSAVAVVVLIWIIGGLLGTDEGIPVVGAGARPTSSSAPPTIEFGTPGTSSTAPSSQTSSELPSATPTSTAPAAPPTVPPTTTTPPPDPNLPCPDAAVVVTAEMEPTAVRVGQRPLLRLVVTNGGPVPCTRDIGRAQRELVITSPDGATRLWSSNDCTPAKGEQRQVLAPGERQAFDVRWAGRTSAKGCPVKRSAVAPGDYLVTGRLGELAGKPVPFTIKP